MRSNTVMRRILVPDLGSSQFAARNVVGTTNADRRTSDAVNTIPGA
jgi:hypothetical protein